jgi:hypothetical protein
MELEARIRIVKRHGHRFGPRLLFDRLDLCAQHCLARGILFLLYSRHGEA